MELESGMGSRKCQWPAKKIPPENQNVATDGIIASGRASDNRFVADQPVELQNWALTAVWKSG
jgi:hypothetical protein